MWFIKHLLLPTNILFEIKGVLLSWSSINRLRYLDTNAEEFETPESHTNHQLKEKVASYFRTKQSSILAPLFTTTTITTTTEKKENYEMTLNFLRFSCRCYLKFTFWKGNYSWEKNLLTNMVIAIHCHTVITRCVLNFSMPTAQYIFINSVSFQVKDTCNSGGEKWWFSKPTFVEGIHKS